MIIIIKHLFFSACMGFLYLFIFSLVCCIAYEFYAMMFHHGQTNDVGPK